MTKYAKYLLLLTVALAMNAQAAVREVDFDAMYDLELDVSLETPEVKNDKAHKNIVAFQNDLAGKLVRQNYNVELMRDGEILIVSIPCDQMFAPNDTLLTSDGKKKIKPLLNYLKNPGFYKVLMVMNSDNTGSETYTLNLTRSRVNAVFNWMDEVEKVNTDYVVPYAVGGTRPHDDHPNNSMSNRRYNRRLEFYFVPFDWMIEQGKKGKVDFGKKQK